MIARVVSCAVGVWLMAAPAVIGYGGPGAINDRICGPLIASVAIIAIWEVTRSLRWINTIFGFWLMFAPLVMHFSMWRSVFNSFVCALLLIMSSLIPGRRTHRFGGGWGEVFFKKQSWHD